MSKKAVFFDIDGTIWDWERRIPQSTIEAIRKLKAAGNYAFICSGRALGNIRNPRLLELGFDGIVAACGGHVEINGEMIFETIVPDDIIRRTVETLIECRLPAVLEGPQKHWISSWGFDKDDFVANIYEAMGSDAVPYDGYMPQMRINKFAGDILAETDYDTVKQRLGDYYNFIEHGLTPDVDQNPGEDRFAIRAVIEAVPKGITKAVGISHVLKRLGLSHEDTYAIGDSANDIEMLEAVGHGIAMGNASQSAKDRAEFVTTDIWEDGISKALEHYGLF